jgi:uncharacterized membrane protein YbhN (UPF0104 family)
VKHVSRVLWTLLKYGVSVLCLVYAFRGVPFDALWTALKGYPLWPALAVAAVSFFAYAVMALRLTRMSAPPISFRSAFCATLAGFAINNVLPARAGEVAKALWLGRSNGVPFQKALGIVFMERFFDVNVLAFLSLWFLWTAGEREAVFVFAACLAGGWGLLALFKRRPRLAERFAGLFGGGAAGRFVSQGLEGVLSNMTPERLLWLSATSLATWFFFGLQTAIALDAAAGLGLSAAQVTHVFAVSSLSMLLPSSPGAIGVYEAFAVTALKNFGVSPEEALAVALFSHMAQYLPVTLAGGAACLFFPSGAENK